MGPFGSNIKTDNFIPREVPVIRGQNLNAERFNARHALMLVHSFSSYNQGFDDFAAFSALFGVTPEIGRVQSLGEANGVLFYTTWIQSDLPAVAHSVSQPLSGKVKARKCPRCGHHEIGIEDSAGRFSALRPGMEVGARGGRVREVIFE